MAHRADVVCGILRRQSALGGCNGTPRASCVAYIFTKTSLRRGVVVALSPYFCIETHDYRPMKLKNLLLIIALLCGVQLVVAQDEKPRGQAIVRAFANFHSGFGAQNDDRGFELDRAYIGYQYDLGKGLSVRGVMDIGAKTDGYDHVAYVKNAGLTWKHKQWTLEAGLISTTQFRLQEKLWGYRYIYKSFQDEYKFGSSADLGVSVAWQPKDWVSLDVLLANGEGYKKVQVKDGLQYALGATFTPVEGFNLRLYASLNEQPGAERKDVMNYSAYAGYNGDKFSVGAEYSLMQNAKGIDGNDQSGVSAYSAWKINRCASVFARYDLLLMKDKEMKSEEEHAVLAGAEFKLGKYVKLSPNFRVAIPRPDGADAQYAAYLSCYFGI